MGRKRESLKYNMMLSVVGACQGAVFILSSLNGVSSASFVKECSSNGQGALTCSLKNSELKKEKARIKKTLTMA